MVRPSVSKTAMSNSVDGAAEYSFSAHRSMPPGPLRQNFMHDFAIYIGESVIAPGMPIS